MTSEISRFFEALNAEEARFIPRLASDNLGIDLRCALNELNWIHYSVTRAAEISFEDWEKFHILQLGINRLVFLALTSRTSYDVPVVLFPRDPAFSSQILDVAWNLGVIQHGRRIAQRSAMGIGEMTAPDTSTFLVKLPSQLSNNSGHEQDVIEQLLDESRDRFSSLLGTEAAKKIAHAVQEKMTELVYPWGTHFIGYDADPLLDEYYYGLAHNLIQLEEGFDSFHYSIKFGGITFQTYILALTFLLGDYMRHEAFAEALIKKDKSIRLENVLTITSDIEKFLPDLQGAVNYFGSSYESFKPIDMDETRVVLRVLSCGRHSAELVNAPGSPLPLIVQCSDEGFIHCPAGARSEPVRYLLEALRYNFGQDYDRNQLSRERSLQRSIERVIGQQISGVDFRGNIAVKVNGKKLTDIDLVAIERASGIIVLFQLKHQDPYGSNIHAEKVRGGRLVEQANHWLNSVDIWLEHIGINGLCQSLQLARGTADINVHKIVVAKHFAHQLKDLAVTEEFLYATWAQLVFAMTASKPHRAPSSLKELLVRLRDIPSLQASYRHQREGVSRWQVGDLRFSVEQAEAGE